MVLKRLPPVQRSYPYNLHSWLPKGKRDSAGISCLFFMWKQSFPLEASQHVSMPVVGHMTIPSHKWAWALEKFSSFSKGWKGILEWLQFSQEEAYQISHWNFTLSYILLHSLPFFLRHNHLFNIYKNEIIPLPTIH